MVTKLIKAIRTVQLRCFDRMRCVRCVLAYRSQHDIEWLLRYCKEAEREREAPSSSHRTALHNQRPSLMSRRIISIHWIPSDIHLLVDIWHTASRFQGDPKSEKHREIPNPIRVQRGVQRAGWCEKASWTSAFTRMLRIWSTQYFASSAKLSALKWNMMNND